MQELITGGAGPSPRPLAELESVIRAASVFELQGALTVGVCLQEAKAQLKHGEWLPWLRKMGIDVSYANRRMRLAAEIPEGSNLSRLSYSQAMAVLALPAGEREAFVEKNDAQDKSAAEIKRLIQERDAEKRRADANAANFRAMRDRADQLAEEAERRPALIQQVEVAPADYAQLKAAAARHAAEMDEATQAAEEAERRAAAAEAELERLRAQDRGAPDDFTAAQGAVNTFLMAVQLLPYNRAALNDLYSRQRYGSLVKAVSDWVEEMREALSAGALEAEGAVVL